MRVLHVVGDYDGTSAYRSLFESQLELGVEPIVVVPAREIAFRVLGPHDSQEPHLEVRRFPTVTRLNRSSLALRTRRFLRMMQRAHVDRFDLVHSHMLFSDGFIGHEIARRNSVPHVITTRGTDRGVQWQRRLLSRNHAREVLLGAQRVVSLNHGYADWLREISPQGSVAPTVIPSGLRDEWLSPPVSTHAVESDDQRSPIQVLYIGKFNPNKNVDKLVSACELVASTTPVRLTCIGATSTDRENGLLPAEGVSGDLMVEVVDKVQDISRLRRFFQDADVLCLPSFQESFGLVLIESLSQGVPVVFSRGQAISGLFSEVDGAFECDPGSVSSIAAAIQRAVNQGRVPATTLGRIQSEFTWRANAASHLQLYQSAQDAFSSAGRL